MDKVIFVCTGNICRSPMAEGILRKIWTDSGKVDFSVTSMGIHGLEGQDAAPSAVAQCAAHGIDISAHKARQLIFPEMDAADIIFCMEKVHSEYIRVFFPRFVDKVHLLGSWPDRAGGGKANIADPYRQSDKVYKKIFDQIYAHIEYVLPFLS